MTYNIYKIHNYRIKRKVLGRGDQEPLLTNYKPKL